MAEKVERWEPDNPDAKDPLLRHSLERARADSAYFTKNREWARWAERETVKRAAEKERAERIEASNADRQKALDARLRAREETAAARELKLEEQREARNARLAENVRRIP